eukprot:6186091-Pleurochrysis_carterae.AAC.3
MLCDSPPPSTGQLSTQSETMPKRVKNEKMLSGWEKGPEKKKRARRDDAAGRVVDAGSRCFGAGSAGSAATCEGGGRPGGCLASASACPAREASELGDRSQGKRRSSKYKSEATTMRLEAGTHTW